jgi:hypothetical protein
LDFQINLTRIETDIWKETRGGSEMRQDLTDITVVLDRSGSMATVINDTIGGFNKFVDDQKKASGAANFTLVQFDTEYEFVHRAINIKDVPSLVFQPRGATALLDAIGKAIVETGERLDKMPEHDRPSKVVFVIITDGEENSSKEYKKARINELIKQQSEKYQWQFVFLGANQDALKEADSLGISTANAMNFSATAVGVKNSFSATSHNLAMYRSGDVVNMAYSQHDRDEAVEATSSSSSK